MQNTRFILQLSSSIILLGIRFDELDSVTLKRESLTCYKTTNPLPGEVSISKSNSLSNIPQSIPLSGSNDNWPKKPHAPDKFLTLHNGDVCNSLFSRRCLKLSLKEDANTLSRLRLSRRRLN